MTIVIALKVGDGVVLGADSASTLQAGNTYVNSYFNAEKLSNVRKGFPVGALTYGLGGLRGRSVGSLLKDLRVRLSDKTDAVWYLDPGTYTMEAVANAVRKYFFDELYQAEYAGAKDPPAMGIIVAGYSSRKRLAEIWNVLIADGKCDPPQCVAPEGQLWSIYWQGQGEALARLVRGWSYETLGRLTKAGMTPAEAQNLLDAVSPMIHETMPIQDAIDLVHYLIDVTCGFVRFSPGNATVAQPIDSAAITPHEGFRWIRRKHYFSPSLNTPTSKELP